MTQIDKIVLRFDADGNIMLPEYFMQKGGRNWVARITGKDEKYGWDRKFLPKTTQKPWERAKYLKDSFELNGIYEIRIELLTPEDKKTIEEARQGMRYRMKRSLTKQSGYSGFWKCVGLTPDGIRMQRMYQGDMTLHFREPDDQTSLDDFIEKKDEKKEKYIL